MVNTERPDRLGVYFDAVYRRDDTQPKRSLFTGSQGFPYLRFVTEVGTHFRTLTLFGRTTSEVESAPFHLPGQIHLVPLPHYHSLKDLPSVAAAAFRTARAMWNGVKDLDVVWAHGPHPFGLMLAIIAKLQGKRVVIAVREDTLKYMRHRLPSPLWLPLLAPLWLMEVAWRALSRSTATIAVGAHVHARYGSARQRPLLLGPSLVRSAQIAPSTSSADWSSQITLLTVGRIEPEKNPLLVLDVLEALEEAGPGEFRWVWIGTGNLSGTLAAEAARRGLGDQLELSGFVPFGTELLKRYREAHVFVHVALTEAFGQVVLEAMSQGIPLIATDVGGVAAAVGDGEAGLLVPPADGTAIADAVWRLNGDPELRNRLSEAGLARAREHTLEAEAARVADFIPR